MASEIESIAWVGSRPWHGIGIELPGPMTSEQAIVEAGLDWTVEKRPVTFSDNYGRLKEISNTKVVIRKSDSSVLGVVSNRYTPVQNVDAFKFMDCLVEEGMMRYDVAGSLRSGQRVWMLGNVGMSEIVPKDKIGHYLLLYNSHDGSGALRCLFTNVRVVCANTARIALQGGRKDGISIRHMGNIANHLQAAKEVLGLAQEAFKKEDEMIFRLAEKHLDISQFNDILKKLFPNTKKDDSATAQAEHARSDVMNLFFNGKGQDLPGVGGTAWAGFNSITEYFNYKKPVRGGSQVDKRFEGSLFGSGAKIIEEARELLLAA